MKTFTATEATQKFSELANSALSEPVSITSDGRVILEMMTPKDKERMFQERLTEKLQQIVWQDFVNEALVAEQHYQETGLHTTLDEMKAWANSLRIDSKKTEKTQPLPTCHK